MSSSISIRLLLTQSDARLIELASEGHVRAFEALVQRHRRALLGYCRRLLLSNERAEDAVQQGLMRAWMALENGSEVRNVKPWLYRIVHNSALNTLRVSGYDYSSLSETLRGADAPEDDLERRIAVREALAGLAALPEMQREALLRTAVDGYSHEEVARSLGLSEGALRGLVYRARLSLRTAATVLTPSPLLHWALGQSGITTPLAARLAEVGAGSGSVGLGSFLLKGSAAVITAGSLAGGLSAMHHRAHHALHVPVGSGGEAPVVAATASNEPAATDAAEATAPATDFVGTTSRPSSSHARPSPPAASPPRMDQLPLTPPRSTGDSGERREDTGRRAQGQSTYEQPTSRSHDGEPSRPEDPQGIPGTGAPASNSMEHLTPSRSAASSGDSTPGSHPSDASTGTIPGGSGSEEGGSQTASTGSGSGGSASDSGDIDGKLPFTGESGSGSPIDEPTSGSQQKGDDPSTR